MRICSARAKAEEQGPRNLCNSLVSRDSRRAEYPLYIRSCRVQPQPAGSDELVAIAYRVSSCKHLSFRTVHANRINCALVCAVRSLASTRSVVSS